MTKLIVLGLLFAGGVLYAASYYVHDIQKEIVTNLTLQVVEQEKTLSNIAEITDRDGADASLESIINDCNARNRNRFDSLLNRLATLNASELLEVESLFNDCGRFFSEKKALMVHRMKREFDVFTDLVSLLSIVDNELAVANFNVDGWGTLVGFENSRSEIFIKQADVQYDIIKALQAGETVGSDTIAKKREEAQNIYQQAVVLNQQIDTLRGTLLTI